MRATDAADSPGRRPDPASTAAGSGRSVTPVRMKDHDSPVASAVAQIPEDPVERVQWRLKYDRAYYAKNCLKVVNTDGHLVPLNPRKAQLKLYAALESQRRAGRPQRAIYLKSRKVGVSTATQGIGIQDTTQNPNWRGLVVAQDNDTASEIHEIAETMYVELPDDVKPPVAQWQTGRGGARTLIFGESSRLERQKGNRGLNSSLKIDTANSVNAGRGKTIFFLHLSEAAFYPDERKTVSVINAVPDTPDSVIVIESTADGFNSFKKRWDRASAGKGGFVAVFLGWTDDETCVRPFDDPDERARFAEDVGRGDYGADEPHLQQMFNCTLEQLNWRRFTIYDKCEGKLEVFRTEYPSFPEEAFRGSGKHVFSVVFMRQAIDDAEEIQKLAPGEGGPQVGVLKETETKERKIPDGVVLVPTKALWVPSEATGFGVEHDFWTRWEAPDPGGSEIPGEPLKSTDPGQYIVTVDPAGGQDETLDEGAYHAIQVLNHRTKEQAAEFETRALDKDQLARQVLLAALLYNNALVSVETNGGYGYPIIRWLWLRGYRRFYRRRKLDRPEEQMMNTIGFDSNTRTKPIMESTMEEALRERLSGIKSVKLALQLTTYVVRKNGKHGPDEEAYADLLTAYMQARQIAAETKLRLAGDIAPVSTWTRPINDPKAGW